MINIQRFYGKQFCKTFRCLQLPDVWLDAEIKDGSIKIERVTIYDEETAEKYQYTEAFYLSEID